MEYNSETVFLGHYSSQNIKDVLIGNLRECDSFKFSVSFIMDSGLKLLFNEIKSALDRGATGEIITTDYMRITSSSVLSELLELMNQYPQKFKAYFLETKSTDYSSFHTKGYVFTKGNVASIIIGSSNMSETALSKDGGEWSLFSKTIKEEKLFSEVETEFVENITEIKHVLTSEQIKQYSQGILNISFGEVSPNYMQIEALDALNKIRINDKKDKAMIVAARGSGKTFLSAFDARNMNSNRILYVCHSETILRKAMTEYEKVFGDSKTYGLFTGESKDIKADILFGTNFTVSKNLKLFEQHDFDYIVIDEAHHGPASTYMKIINFFKPNFLLGMTGTPDRSDQLSAKKVFGDNIPYELKMKDAITNDLIMPFKYYSVYDSELNYDKQEDPDSLMASMTDIKHGQFIDENIKAHLHEIKGKLKCLAFCVNVEHAKRLCSLMNNFGYVCEYVFGGTTISDRQRLYNNLQDESNPLQIIFSVNVLNEGADLPAINMSLFLRPTDSTIIFIQQLGRCLRKHKNKNKPIIIDFIGNKYKRSIYIGLALGELTSSPILTKPIIKNVLEGEDKIVKDLGVDIKLDSQSLKEIEDHLEKENFNRLEVLTKNYKDFKTHYNLSTYPAQVNFVSNPCGFDLMRIIGTHKSYYNFLLRIKEDNVPIFNKAEIAFIEYLSSFLPLSRQYEFKIIRALIQMGPMTEQSLFEYVKQGMMQDRGFSEESYNHAIDVLLLKTESETNQKLMCHYLVLENGTYRIDIPLQDKKLIFNDEIIELDIANSQFRTHVLDVLDYGLAQFSEVFDGDGSSFELYRTYTRKEFTRVLNFRSVYNFQPGVFYVENAKTVGIFVDMIKKEGVEEHLNYGDKFISPNHFIWESQTETEIGNNRYKKIMSYPKAEIFVRKTQKENGLVLPYVYLGKGTLKNPKKTTNTKKTLTFDIYLDKSLPDYLFEQFNIEDK